MKLGNFRSLDPEYSGVGLSQIAKGDQQIWTEFAGAREQLSKVAAAIRSTYSEVSIDGLSEETGIDDEERLEGRVLMRVHKQRERNRSLVQRKKEKILAETGRLACEVCSFNFEEVYGEHGRGFAECHHLTPLAELRAGQKTRLSDLAIVCANCHRMIHRGTELLTPEELSQLMISSTNQG
ncbi:MAG: HNH endonuclease [Chloroflexota bacterium]